MCVCVCVCVSMRAVYLVLNLSFLRMSVCVCLYAYCLLSIFKPFISVCVCDRERDSFNEFSIVNVFYVFCFTLAYQGSPTLLLESYRPTDFSSNPNQNTPEPANHSLQGYLLISDRCWSRVLICRMVALQEQGWRSLI